MVTQYWPLAAGAERPSRGQRLETLVWSRKGRSVPPIITTTEIAAYEANVVSNGEPNQLAATVWLFKADRSLIAFLRFYRPGTVPAPNEFRPDLNAALVSYWLDALPSVVDILRNEKPLYFTWFDYSAQVPGRMFGILGTSLEPVGEEE